MLKHFLAAACLLLGLCVQPATALRLEEAVGLALARNEAVLAADQDARAAAARVGRARALLLPSLDAEAGWTRFGEGVASRAEGLEGSVTLSQTLFSARAFPLLSQARRGREAARLEADEARRGLAYATAAAFLDALDREQLALAAARRRDLAAQALAEIRVRFGAQLTGSNDVTRAELEAASAEREWVRARGEARVARLSLDDLLNAGTAAGDSLETPVALLELAERPQTPPDPAEAARARTDLQAARARLEALRQSALEPLARWAPDLDLSGTTSATEDEGLDAARDNWILALGLSWPLFDGGGREADRAERLALARAAELRLAGLERRVSVELEAARATLESAQASLDRSRVAREAARRNMAETTELYRQGLARALDVVDANVQLFEAEAGLVRARSALASAFLGLRQAAGLDPFAKETLP